MYEKKKKQFCFLINILKIYKATKFTELKHLV